MARQLTHVFENFGIISRQERRSHRFHDLMAFALDLEPNHSFLCLPQVAPFL
jgi:hypothetical protein